MMASHVTPFTPRAEKLCRSAPCRAPRSPSGLSPGSSVGARQRGGNVTRRQATTFRSLPPNRTHALELLAAGARPSVVASTLGVHRATVWKWTQDPEFQE